MFCQHLVVLVVAVLMISFRPLHATTATAVSLSVTSTNGATGSISIQATTTNGATGVSNQGAITSSTVSAGLDTTTSTSISVSPTATSGVVTVTTGFPSPVTTTAPVALSPTITAISPRFGPLAGGTTVTFTGTHLLNITAIAFQTDSAIYYFTIAPHVTQSSMTAVTPLFNESATEPPEPLGVWTASTYNATLTKQPVNFQYLPNPVITSVAPEKPSTIVSGGIRVTAIGANLLSVAAPQLLVWENYLDQNLSAVVISNNCEVDVNGTSMVCTTPRVHISADMNDTCDPLSCQTGNPPLNEHYFFGFGLDGVLGHRNWSELTVYRNPYITVVSAPRPFLANVNGEIQVTGSNLRNAGFDVSDVSVLLVAKDSSPPLQCQSLQILDSKTIECTPPPIRPYVIRYETLQNQPDVVLHIGSYSLKVATLQYTSNDHLHVVICVMIAVIAFIIVVSTVCGILTCCGVQTVCPSCPGRGSSGSSALNSHEMKMTGPYETLGAEGGGALGKKRRSLKGTEQTYEELRGDSLHGHSYELNVHDIEIETGRSHGKSGQAYTKPGHINPAFAQDPQYAAGKPSGSATAKDAGTVKF